MEFDPGLRNRDIVEDIFNALLPDDPLEEVERMINIDDDGQEDFFWEEESDDEDDEEDTTRVWTLLRYKRDASPGINKLVRPVFRLKS